MTATPASTMPAAPTAAVDPPTDPPGAPFRPAALRPVGVGLVAAGVVWTTGTVAEILFARTDTLDDGASFVVISAVQYAAMITFAWALLAAAHRGLAGGSRLGKAGLIVTACGYALVMVAGIPVQFFDIQPAAAGLAVGGIGLEIGEILAGIGILRGSPVPRPARAVFLVYALAYVVSVTLVEVVSPTQTTATGFGPGHLIELTVGAFWALIGLTILKPGPGRRNVAWFGASLVVAAIGLSALALPH